MSVRARIAVLVLALSATPAPRAVVPGFLWIDDLGRPNSAAYDALVLLDDAGLDGLNPGDYRVAALRDRAEELAAATGVTRDAQQFDAELGAAMTRFLRDLHAGRVDPGPLGAPDLGEPDDPDYAALLRSAAETGRLGGLVRALTPAGPQYHAIRRALIRYRNLERDGADRSATLARLPYLAPGGKADLRDLRAWLMATGDLSAASPETGTAYVGALVDAVGQFQTRHGLTPDGIIGAQTLEALSTPLATRIRQLELALERLRWLRALPPGRLVVVNIPMFRLWAWNDLDARRPPDVTMRAVVGRAVATETPMLIETMTHVVLGPYWNVPHPIVIHEILPLVARDAGYLSKAHMELVEGASDDAPVVPATRANLARLRAGSLRLRQRPGPDNAMGAIKFVFPNEYLVFIHGTSDAGIFTRTRRDVSHGCIRVEDPLSLAAWALQGADAWSVDAIARTAPSAVSLRIDLPRPPSVLVVYLTAAVLPDDGRLHFSEDIYGWDRALDRALRERR